MAETVGQHGLAAFVNPSNGDALDATVVKANDNTIRTAYVGHDDDGGIHVQSSLLASRPAASTIGRKWLTTDAGNMQLWYDNGSTWEPMNYVSGSGNAAISGDLSVGGNATITGSVTANGNVTLGDTSSDVVTVTGRIESNLTPKTDALWDIGITGNYWRNGRFTGAVSAGSVSATTLAGSLAASSLTGTTLPSTITSSSLTSVGTLSSLTVGGTVAMVDNLLTRPVIKDYGETRTTPSISSGTLTLNLENGNVFGVALNANITTLTIANPSASGTACSFTLAFTADGTLRTVSWPASVKWSNATPPTLTSTNGKVDIFTFVTWDAGTTWYGFVAGANF